MTGHTTPYGDAVYAAAEHTGIPVEQIDRFLGTIQMCGWHLSPVSEKHPSAARRISCPDCAHNIECADYWKAKFDELNAAPQAVGVVVEPNERPNPKPAAAAPFAQSAGVPCDMGEMCLDCQPRGPNGECPDAARSAGEETIERLRQRSAENAALAFQWMQCHDALLGFIQKRPVFKELIENDPRPPMPNPESTKTLADKHLSATRPSMEEAIVEVIRRIGVKGGIAATVYGEMCHEVRTILRATDSAPASAKGPSIPCADKIVSVTRAFDYDSKEGHAPWVMVFFKRDDWESRDAFAAALATADRTGEQHG